MHILIWETLSFNLIYVTACYPVGTTISKTSSLFTALLQHYMPLHFCISDGDTQGFHGDMITVIRDFFIFILPLLNDIAVFSR